MHKCIIPAVSQPENAANPGHENECFFALKWSNKWSKETGFWKSELFERKNGRFSPKNEKSRTFSYGTLAEKEGFEQGPGAFRSCLAVLKPPVSNALRDRFILTHTFR